MEQQASLKLFGLLPALISVFWSALNSRQWGQMWLCGLTWPSPSKTPRLGICVSSLWAQSKARQWFHLCPSAPRSAAFFWLNRASVRCMWLSHKPTHSSKILSCWKSSFDSVLLIPAFQFIPSVGGDQGGYSLLRTNRDAAISKTEIGSISV